MANYFSIFLVAVSFITGVVWLAYSLFFAPKKNKASLNVDSGGSSALALDSDASEMPPAVDFCKQMFPIFFGVMIFRSFLFEPFQIPSGSMFPTLLVGDFLLVEKYAYSLKDPVARNEILKTGEVKRGDVVVFKYPDDPSIDYIKRVVGLPGETIYYRGKRIFIQAPCEQGAPCPPERIVELNPEGRSDFMQGGTRLTLFTEQLGEATHQILQNPRRLEAPGKYVIPEGEYFVMGDNRDNSQDSRFWGYVPEENLVGRAVFVWMSFEFGRTPDDFLPTFIPTDVRFERIGAIQ